MNKMQLFMLSVYGVIIALMGSSIKNTYQVYLNTMSDDFSLARGDFLMSGALFMIGVGFFSPLAGLIADKYGIRKVIYLGIVLSSASFFLLSFSQSFIVFMFAYGILASFAYSAISYIPLGIIIYDNIPSGSKNFVYALVTNGTALGFVILSPLWLLLEGYFGWREVYLILTLIFILPLILYSKYIFSYVNVKENTKDNLDNIPKSNQPSVFFKHPAFYLLMIGFFGCGFTMAYIDVHWVSQLKDKMVDAEYIAIFLIIFGVAEFVGALASGKLLDKYNYVTILSGCYLIRFFSLLALFYAHSLFAIVIFATLFGLSFMGTVISTTALIIKLFPQNKGFILGFIWLSHQVGASLSVRYGGVLYDNTSSYHIIISVTAAIALISAAISLFILKFNKYKGETLKA